MLNGTAAAVSEMLAGRGNSLRAGEKDFVAQGALRV
jgi:hypothetical protein